MKIPVAFICVFLCACSHTEKKIGVVDVNIPVALPQIELKEILVVENEPLNLPFPEVQYEQKLEPYWICGGVYPSSEEKLVSLSLEELEKNYGALVVTNSYKKWIPIEGEPETVLVFNFNK